MNDQRADHRPPLLTVEQAAQHLGISVRTVRGLIADGHLDVIRVSTGRLAIDPVDLDRYIDARRSSRASH